MIDITGKWALVTGSSRGVGMRIARALSEKGCKVILHSRTLKGTDGLLKELTAAGATAHAVAAQLNDFRQVEAMIAEVGRITGGNLDILYNNAGIMSTYRDMFTPTVEDYQACFMVNTIVPAKLCDAFVPGMLKRNWGRVVNVTSGIADQPQLMPYSCSKAALDRYVRDMLPTLAGTNVLMNLMDPGWLRTDMGGPKAENDPDTVLPGALVPVLIDQDQGSGVLYPAQDYRQS